MAIKINDEQAEKINGIPINQIMVKTIVFDRDDSTGNNPFAVTIKFKMAMRSDTGAYVPTGAYRTVVIHDADAFALAQAMVGDMRIVECDNALQDAIALCISTQCVDLSSAQVEVV